MKIIQNNPEKENKEKERKVVLAWCDSRLNERNTTSKGKVRSFACFRAAYWTGGGAYDPRRDRQVASYKDRTGQDKRHGHMWNLAAIREPVDRQRAGPHAENIHSCTMYIHGVVCIHAMSIHDACLAVLLSTVSVGAMSRTGSAIVHSGL